MNHCTIIITIVLLYYNYNYCTITESTKLRNYWRPFYYFSTTYSNKLRTILIYCMDLFLSTFCRQICIVHEQQRFHAWNSYVDWTLLFSTRSLFVSIIMYLKLVCFRDVKNIRYTNASSSKTRCQPTDRQTAKPREVGLYRQV